MKRNLRPRSAAQYVSQQEWLIDEEQIVPHRRYSVCSKFDEEKYQQDLGLVREMQGVEFTLRYVQECGLTHPLVFRDSKGLGIKAPPSTFTVRDVKRLVGSKRVVDVMDTCTQEGSTMTMNEWTKYYETHPRQKLLNVISLEISCTKLSPLVEPPDMVRQLDWVELVWPNDLKSSQTDPTNNLCRMMYPKVQKYCLMSVAGCYTDFHLDFGGTSVWYHIVKGEKLFLLIPPTEENYSLFQTWQMSCEQEGVFFAELVEKAQLVRLKEGDTFIMPSGWIHGVYTPTDSLVFGGNFLHSFNISQQLRVADMEHTIKVPSKFRYPFYGTMHWYVLMAYHQELTNKGVEANDGDITIASNRRWLKGVELERVSMSEDIGSEKCGPISDLKQEPVGSHCDEHFVEPPPCLSEHEKEGLLLLIQNVRQLELFANDVPPSLITSSTELLDTLQRQLCSSTLEETCPSRPSGVSLLKPPPPPPPPHLPQATGSPKRKKESTYKRQRTSKTSMTTSKKHKQATSSSSAASKVQRIRQRRRTKRKHSVVVSLQLSTLLSPPKSQDEDEEDCCCKGAAAFEEQFPPDDESQDSGLDDTITNLDIKVPRESLGELKTDKVFQETLFQLSPDHSPSSPPISISTGSTPLTESLVEYNSPLVSNEQDSPYSSSSNNTTPMYTCAAESPHTQFTI